MATTCSFISIAEWMIEKDVVFKTDLISGMLQQSSTDKTLKFPGLLPCRLYTTSNKMADYDTDGMFYSSDSENEGPLSEYEDEKLGFGLSNLDLGDHTFSKGVYSEMGQKRGKNESHGSNKQSGYGVKMPKSDLLHPRKDTEAFVPETQPEDDYESEQEEIQVRVISSLCTLCCPCCCYVVNLRLENEKTKWRLAKYC